MSDEVKQVEEAVEEAVETVDVEEIGALFAADMEPERVYVPGYGRRCYFDLRPMDADAYSRYMQVGQTIMIKGDKFEQTNIQVNVAEQELYLLLSTVEDFCLVRKVPVEGGGSTMEETTPPIKNRKEFMEKCFKGFTPKLRQWLVKECRRVNGLLEEQTKN